VIILLSTNRNLIEDAKDEVMKQNKSDLCELAELIILLMDKKEKMLASYFLLRTETEIENVMDNSDYREILFDGYRPDVLELYFSLPDLQHNKIWKYFDDDTSYQDIEDFYNLLEGFYHAAINANNLSILQHLIDIWDLQISVHGNHEEHSDEARAFANRINDLNLRALELCHS
jgi:hypothetical protein